MRISVPVYRFEELTAAAQRRVRRGDKHEPRQCPPNVMKVLQEQCEKYGLSSSGYRGYVRHFYHSSHQIFLNWQFNSDEIRCFSKANNITVNETLLEEMMRWSSTIRIQATAPLSDDYTGKLEFSATPTDAATNFFVKAIRTAFKAIAEAANAAFKEFQTNENKRFEDKLFFANGALVSKQYGEFKILENKNGKKRS